MTLLIRVAAAVVVGAACVTQIFAQDSGAAPGRASVQLPTSAVVGFAAAAPMPVPGAAHAAVSLPGGDVLVTGGFAKLFGKLPVAITAARIYDHRTGTWRVAKGRLNLGRLEHAAVTLPTGQVLIVGGLGQDKKPLRSIELYDTQTERFALIGKTALPRHRPCLNLLPDGSVLITGNHQQAEIIEPPDDASDQYTIRIVTARMNFRHIGHTSVSLTDGSVLLIGGRAIGLERFDPESETFTACRAHLPKMLDDQAAALLVNGKVLIAGGQNFYTNRCVAECWLYDPNLDRLEVAGLLSPTAAGVAQLGAADLKAIDLFAGDAGRKGRFILLCGGEYDPGRQPGPDAILDFAQVYDAQESTFIDVGPMLYPHDEFALAALPAGPGRATVLIIAGHGPGDSFTNRCELFTWRWPLDQQP